jgi:hypothetical protein
MISTDRTRVKIKEVVASQLPNFVQDNYPLLKDFFETYYASQEYSGSPLDLLQNIDQYFNLDSLTNNTKSCILNGNISPFDTTINVVYNPSRNLLGTYGFPDRYGLIKINDEIILYKSKTQNSFNECFRGFSGITNYQSGNDPEQLVFTQTNATDHSNESNIENLSILFLENFLRKIKDQFLPGFEDRNISPKINQKTLISRISDFYDSKGTEESIRILFGILYGENVEVINPKDFLIKPSDALFRKTKDLVVEAIEGDPLRLKNRTLVQDSIPEFGIKKAEAFITNVQKESVDNKDYYRISVDYEYDQENNAFGGISAPFTIHPYTKSISTVSAGSTIFDVDSTIGFPSSGRLAVSYPNGITRTLSYKSKSLTQFFGVDSIPSQLSIGSTIRLDTNVYGYPGISTSDVVKARVTSVLKDIRNLSDGFYFSTNDSAKITYLGIANTEPKANDWFLNIPIKYSISELTLIDVSNLVYRVKTIDDMIFRIGDIATLSDTFNNTLDCSITSIIDKKTFTIRGQGLINGSGSYFIERRIKKSSVSSALTKYSYINNYNSDIQNIYSNFDDELLVASPSIPAYRGQPLSFYDKTISISGSFNGDILTFSDINEHGFYTGDAVYYQPGQVPVIEITFEGVIDTGETSESRFSNFGEGIYYVKRLNQNQIKLARSKSDIFKNNFLNVSGIVTSNVIGPSEFKNLSIRPQNLLRFFNEPNNESGVYETPTDSSIGMFVNGVELTNYKSSDFVRFGEIESATVTKSGQDYDIINPPVLRIYDSTGIGATGTVSVKGNLNRIEVIDTGFDYVTDPYVDITGGNGLGAEAKVNTSLIVHSVSFDSRQQSSFVDLSNNTIGFSSYHKFRSVEQVTYKTDGETGIIGLSTNSLYYVKVVDSNTVKLFKNENDASLGINTVSLNGFGNGIHRLESVENKRIVTSVIVTNPGKNYQNKERTCQSIGINTSLNQINIKNHGYESKEVLTYSSSETLVSGLSSSLTYVVTKVDNDNFKLSHVGTGLTDKYFYFNTKQYVNLNSIGSGTHIFNYEPIEVKITGKIGVSTLSNQDFSAKLQPIFRGEIEDVNIRLGGVGYGSSDILNYDRQPNYEILNGSGAELIPVVNNGSITDVVVNYGGKEYNSPPNLLVIGDGDYAILTPILNDGRITEVKIINGGSGYSQKSTSIAIISAGSDANLNFKIKQWNVNLFQKNLNIVSDDDGFIKKGINESYELQYCHLYTPRKLRESVYQKTQDNVEKYGVFDLQLVNGQESTSKLHSPIIGWAYDGNPIYGPYGFTSNSGGTTRLMKSSYKIVSQNNRPLFPLGFFVEDYEFDNSGDLDEHNGRYCVTPEYPNGVYAYFTTIDDTFIENSKPFIGYRKPVFPYVIGNTFKSKPIDFNFIKTSNQDEFDFEIENENSYPGPWLRNTNVYNQQSSNTFYEYFTSPLNLKTYNGTVKASTDGRVESISIINGGSDYKVGDKIVFDNEGTGGKSASAIISQVAGKDVTSISVASTSISQAEITPSGRGSYVVYTENPHNLLNNDIVSISGVTTSSLNLEGIYNIGISSEKYLLLSGIGDTSITGIVTYISISGDLGPSKIRENDILQINSERFKVLNIDLPSSRVRVLRSVVGVASTHVAGSLVNEIPRKFFFNSPLESNITFNKNKEIYFNPKESVGLGTLSGVGIGSTIVFSNVGTGITQILIPTRSIYLPQHELTTGEEIIYSNNGGSSIIVSNGSTSFALQNLSTVYAANISNDLIGISTVKIGLGTTGTFVGIGSTNIQSSILYFKEFGSGVYHSFKTVKKNSVKCEVNKNIVTVSTASSHGLKVFDDVDLSVKPSNSRTIKVIYNDYNRRFITNPKNFTSVDVDVLNNTIFIQNHGLKTGDAVIHTSNSPSVGLEDQKIYYVINFTKDLIKLSLSKYGTETFEKNIVNITSSSNGTISQINPNIEIYRNNRIIFDLSDSSLSSLYSSNRYSAFELNLYTDEEFTQSFFGKLSKNSFNVSKVGQVGISSNASLILNIDDDVPSKLFYNLEPINSDFVSQEKKEIVIDEDIVNHNLLSVLPSKYSGSHVVSGVGTSSFNYNISNVPESSSYNTEQASIVYFTSSINTSGGISSVKINYGGYGYTQVPGISTVITENGKDSILIPFSSGIGTILSVSTDLIGYDFPSDKTLRPSCNLPEIFKVVPFNSLDFIGVTSFGNGYSIAPSLILIDEYENRIIDDVDLKFTIGKNQVDILKNTKGLTGKPKIIPINNSNGVKISSIVFDSSTKNVSVGLNTGFSDIFPFSLGDKVLIENVSIGIGSTGKGYNSEGYNYKLFILTGVPAGNTGLGGNVGIVTFNMSEFLSGSEFPGNFDSVNSAGRIIAEKDFPIFNINLKKNTFANGETIISELNNKSGIVESWNDKINILKVSSSKEFLTGDLIIGTGTKTRGIVGDKYDFDCYVDTDSTSPIVNGWENEIGFLNNNLHRIQNNEYYQNFSYSLKSKVSFDEWNNAVGSLSHSSGFAKFSDLQLESLADNSLLTYTPDSGSFIDITNDLVSEIDLSCYTDYDAVSENKLTVSNKVISSEIYFSSRVLTDYFESVGNRVLLIDDVSNQFSSEPRPTPYSIIAEFSSNEKVKKYFTYIRDKRFTSERQSLFVSIVHNGVDGYINQYGRVETVRDLGAFDVSFSNNNGYLLFYPTLFEVNDYDISYFNFCLNDTVAGIGSTSLGDTVKIQTQNAFVATSTTGNIVSIGTSYRASKILLEIIGSDGRYGTNEISILHDGTNVELLEYGQMTTSGTDSYESSGLGTYSAYISGSNLNIDFTPTSGIGVTVNTINISIADTASTGIGTYYFGFDSESIAFIDSSITSIASSTSPIENVIAKYNNSAFNPITSEDQHDASYFIVCVEDITNNEYQMSEVIVVDDDTTTYITEYGNVETSSGLGTIGAGVGTTFTELYFTPNPNINVQVRVFQTSLQLVTPTPLTPNLEIDLNNAKLNVGFSFYTGTFSDVKREFGLTHNGRNIFQRYFLGSDSSIVDITENTITIPEHFYVTGEELVYTHGGIGNTHAIGVATTDFGAGIGVTNLLPSRVFAIKVNESKIRLARNAQDALKSNPVALDITHVGIGTSHTFTSKNQNGKCLISIDNYIQSPIVATAITSGLSTSITLVDDVIKLTGVTSFFGGDLIKIGDEIMKIRSVGFGDTNSILVRRPWMGTGLSTHSQTSVITKVQGEYNIVNNIISFVDSPRGPIPIGSSTNSPDERDWSGITTFSKFQGRVFLRSGVVDSLEESYTKNYIFDDISEQFNAINKTFTLKSNNQNITGFSTNNSIVLINGIFQIPQGTLLEVRDYQLTENSGITSINFLGAATSTSNDPNTASIPVGGVIVSVGSTAGFGYQPLVSAGGTAIVSVAGTISAISIGNSGSGYRAGIQTVVNVGVYTSSTETVDIEYVGFASISDGHIINVNITNPGSGYTSSNPPIVVFDSPLSYTNIPLIYSSSYPSGFGTEATIDIVVGQGSSVIDFEISNFGYSYGNGQILTIETGGNSGIPTDPSRPFSEFQIKIEKVISDSFSGWNVGELELFDKIESKFDGSRRSFTLSKNSSPVTIRAKKGSNIDIQSTLLVFINNILQIPGESYTLSGGSVITFSEPPKPPVNGIPNTGDTCDILFYRGSGEIDVQFVDVIETVKVGDSLTINDSQDLCANSIQQDERLVTEIISSDIVETNPYVGPGINNDPNCTRPVTWCQQRNDKLVNGIIVGKSRVLYEPLVNPVSYVIQNVGIASTEIFVDNIKTFFDPYNENQTSINQKKILIISNDEIVSASATSIVSLAGTIESIAISTGGKGYASAPEVSIANPVGLGTTQRAIASASVTSGIVTSITVSFGGTQYTSSNPPIVLIEPPSPIYEINDTTLLSGDFGNIVGVSTTSVGVASTGIVFKFHIPNNSYLRSSSVMGNPGITTISGIQTGYYFVAYNTNVGSGTGLTSLYSNGSILGVGTQFLDNVYQVASVSVAQTSLPGIGITYVAEVTVSVTNNTAIIGSANTTFFGEYSWGRILLGNRVDSKSFSAYTKNGFSGISSSASIRRVIPLKYQNYI